MAGISYAGISTMFTFAETCDSNNDTGMTDGRTCAFIDQYNFLKTLVDFVNCWN